MKQRLAAMLIVMAAALLVTPHPGASAPTPSESPTATADLVPYLLLPGDQVVTVPDGTYAGGSIAAPHPETTGPYAGWLILQAATPYGVTVTGDLTLEPGTTRVMFVGFRFVNTRLFIAGEQIVFWYSDHVFPDLNWYAEGRQIPRQVFLRHPARVISLLGSDLHDGVASPINISGVTNVDIAGVRVYDILEPSGSDPEDLSHLNVISLLGGATTDLTVSQSYFQGARLNHQTDDGDVSGLIYDDVWFTGAFGAAFQFNATNGNRIAGGARIDVRSWGHVGALPRDRVDIVDGVTVPVGSRPDRVEVVDRGVVNDPPPDGAEDPATRWRRQHPYESWADYFGWAQAPSG